MGRPCVLQRYRGMESDGETMRSAGILVPLMLAHCAAEKSGFLFRNRYWHNWERACFYSVRDSELEGELVEQDQPPFVSRAKSGIERKPDGSYRGWKD